MFCKSFSFRRHVLRILLLINHSCYSSPLRLTNLTSNWFPVLPCNNLFPQSIPWLVYLFEFTVHHSINCIFPQINLSFCHDVTPISIQILSFAPLHTQCHALAFLHTTARHS